MDPSQRDVRLHIYRWFVERGRPPTVAETAATFGAPEERVATAFQALAEGRVIVLEPGTLDVWMANPLSARPTPYPVETADGRSYFGNCAWDAPGVLAMLGADGRVPARCPDCGEPLELRIERGMLAPLDAVAHFSVPAARWWEDIGFT
jgi:hypothetical protein